EADEVELAQRREAFQAVERESVAAQLLLEIDPGCERPLARPLRVAIHDGVEHLQAVMAHAQRVRVGKGEAQLAANVAMVLGDTVEFAAKVLRRRLHARQERQDGVFERAIEHGVPPRDRYHYATTGRSRHRSL